MKRNVLSVQGEQREEDVDDDDNPGRRPPHVKGRMPPGMEETLEFSRTKVDIHKTAHFTCQTAMELRPWCSG